MKTGIHKKLTQFIVVGLAFSMLASSACTTAELIDLGLLTHTPNADYGDAPDDLSSKYPSGITAEFPTRYSSTGAHHLDITDSAFGPFQDDGSLSVSAEDDATDPADPDGVQNIDEPTGESDRDDFDDGLLTGFVAPGVMNSIDFLISVAPTAPKMTRYVNMLMDWNQDGEWKGMDLNGAEEWIVKNMPIDVAPGTTEVLTTPDFLAGLENNVWLRMTLSETPVEESLYPEGWDGTGVFELGETEDYLLQETTVWDFDDPTGKIGGGPGGGGPGGGGAGGGGAGACEQYKSYNVTLCKGRSRRFLALVDGFAPDSVTASSDNPSVASVSVNEANVTITGNEEGSTTVRLEVREGNCTYYITVHVKVKDCSEKKPKIECCTPAEIKKDPSRCKNCKVVGWRIYTNETPGGGGDSVNGGITLTGEHGQNDDCDAIKSTVVTVFGNVVKIIVNCYKCEECPCDEEAKNNGDIDGDKIPDEIDRNPYQPYDPANPGSYEEQLFVDSFFDVFFDVNNDQEIFDQADFEYPEYPEEEYQEEYQEYPSEEYPQEELI